MLLHNTFIQFILQALTDEGKDPETFVFDVNEKVSGKLKNILLRIIFICLFLLVPMTRGCFFVQCLVL